MFSALSRSVRVLIRVSALGLLVVAGCQDTPKGDVRPALNEPPVTLEPLPDSPREHRVEVRPEGNVRLTPPVVTSPGVTLRRLTGDQYNRTVRDLMGTTLRPGDAFPAEFVAHGFDHLAEALSLSPYLMRQYAEAAKRVAADAMKTLGPTQEWVLDGEDADISHAFPIPGIGQALYQETPFLWTLDIPDTDTYTLAIRLYGQASTNGPPEGALMLDGEAIHTWTVDATASKPEVLTQELTLEPGSHTIGLMLTNPDYPTQLFDGNGRMIVIDWLSLTAQNIPPVEEDLQQRILICDPDEVGIATCSKEVVTTFLSKAWRRPPSEAETTRYTDLIASRLDVGDSFVDAVQTMVQTALSSPHFLFLVETNEEQPVSSSPVKISAHQLATRLSYFLWGSMPDDTLRSHADNDTLFDPETLDGEVERMLIDPRAADLMARLTKIWLSAGNIQFAKPDATLFPDYSQTVKAGLADEMRIFLAKALEDNLTLKALLTTDHTYLNETLAEYYGYSGPGDEFTFFKSPDGRRGGLLRMAGLLTLLSHPTKTSAVRRGKWIYESLLCGSVPVPAEIPPLPIEAEILKFSAKGLSELHLNDPSCAGCHALMDPIGLALENYGPTGKWRDDDDGLAIDPAGQLPEGAAFSDVEGLVQAIANDARYTRCMVTKVFTFALARRPLPEEAPLIDALVEALENEGGGIRTLIRLLATHEVMQKRLPHPGGTQGRAP